MNKGEWIMFDEINYLKWVVITAPSNERDKSSGTLDFTEKDSPAAEIQICFMNKNQLLESEVWANSPIYILNNEGKTIERL